jgi:hypothetical protein
MSEGGWHGLKPAGVDLQDGSPGVGGGWHGLQPAGVDLQDGSPGVGGGRHGLQPAGVDLQDGSPGVRELVLHHPPPEPEAFLVQLLIVGRYVPEPEHRPKLILIVIDGVLPRKKL